MIISILEDEWDRRITEENWKRKEQFERNLLHYKNLVVELNKQWAKEIKIALETKKEDIPRHWWEWFKNTF